MDRLLLTLGLIVVIGLAIAGLRLGWRNRLARQQAALPDFQLPTVPADLGADLVEPLAGLYVSTTPAGRWQDRIVLHGLGRRARVLVHLTAAGVLLDRTGEEPVFVPRESLREVGTAPGIAGKVMGMPDGVLVLTWTTGAHRLDTGVRADDLDAQQDWLAAARRMTTNDGASA